MKALQKQEFQCTRADSGFVVSLPLVTIVVGKDPDHESFMVNIQDDRGEESESTSFDKLQQPEVLALCATYRPAQATAPETPALV